MSRLTYGFELWLNDALGVSILDNPLEIVGIIIIAILEVVVFLLAYRSFKSYRETKEFGTLMWLLAFVFLFIGVIFLIIEKLAYSTFGNLGLGDFMTILALIASGTAIVFFNIFSYHTAYPDYEGVLSIVVTALAALYVGSLSAAIISGSADIVNNEPIYPLAITLISFFALIPIVAIAPAVFFIFYSRNRETERPHALRGLWIGISFLLFAIGYVGEAVPILETIAVIFRAINLTSASIMYICLVMPEWFKTRIGWT